MRPDVEILDSTTRKVENPLVYRRQFLLSRKTVPELEGWQHQKLGDLNLFAHPDLQLTAEHQGSASLILLGSVFDPANPKKGDIFDINDLELGAIGQFRVVDIIRADWSLVEVWALPVES